MPCNNVSISDRADDVETVPNMVIKGSTFATEDLGEQPSTCSIGQKAPAVHATHDTSVEWRVEAGTPQDAMKQDIDE
jgi:hypothetical protein